MANEAKDSRGSLARTLAHPAALLLLTALLTGLLVPWITNRWEARDREVQAMEAARDKEIENQRAASERQLELRRAAIQREREVESEIVSGIAAASASFLSAIEVGLIDRARQPEASAEYRALKTASLATGSQLAAYFPGSLPAQRWRNYAAGLRNAYLLLTESVGRPRNVWLDRLNRYLDRGPGHLDGLCFASSKPEHRSDLRALVVAFQNKEEEIVRDVIDSDTVLTGTPTPDRTTPLKSYDKTQKRPCDKWFKPVAR